MLTFEVTRERLLVLRRWSWSEAGPDASASLRLAILTHQKKGWLCSGHKTGGSHINAGKLNKHWQ